MPSKGSSSYHRWRLHYSDPTFASPAPNAPRTAAVRAVLDTYACPPGFPSSASRTPAPLNSSMPEGSASTDTSTVEKPVSSGAIKAVYASSWSLAWAPLRTLLTSAFALFMSGSSVHFFSVASTLTVLFMHLRAMLSVSSTFRRVKSSKAAQHFSLLPQMFLNFLFCSAGVALGAYKANTLGFLPTTESDWIVLLPLRYFQPGVLRDAVTFA